MVVEWCFEWCRSTGVTGSLAIPFINFAWAILTKFLHGKANLESNRVQSKTVSACVKLVLVSTSRHQA